MIKITSGLRKRASWAVVAALSIPLLVPLMAASEPGPGGGRHFGPRPHVGRMLEKHADELGLDEATLSQIRDVVANAREQSKAVRQAQRQEQRVLRELMAQPSPDRAAIMSQLEVIGQLRTELGKQRMGSWLEVRSLLTPEQLEKLKQLRSERRREFRKRFHGRRGERDAGDGSEGALVPEV